MTKDEFKQEMAAIKSEAHMKTQTLYKKFALSNNDINVGDVITDHYHTIKVESISINRIIIGDYPCMCYTGIQLTKDGKVAKRQVDIHMSQYNIKFRNGEPYECSANK